MQEREDDVKTMNAMVQYSRTVAIRDAQLREKKLIARKKILEEKREGILMEIARIKQVSGIAYALVHSHFSPVHTPAFALTHPSTDSIPLSTRLPIKQPTQYPIHSTNPAMH